MTESIVVTGIGAVCPLGTGAGEVWKAFAAGESGVRRLRPDDERLARGVDPCAAPEIGVAGWVRGFRPREHVRSPQLRRMDWCSRMLVAAVRQAFDDAGALPLEAADSERAALVVCSCYGNQRETATYLERVLGTGPAAGQPMLFPNLVLNAAAGYAAIELDVQGPNLCVAEHEASGEAALAAAMDLLRSGACEVVCAGGVDEIGGVQTDALADLRLLCRDSLPDQRRERALRAGRGARAFLVPGEGAAAMVLETEGRARARGARAYAKLVAARVVGGAGSPYVYADAEAAERLLALVPDGPIDGVLGGAAGLAARDRIDAAVLGRLVERSSRPVGYSPYRRLVGEWGAAGALGAVLGALALHHGRLPGAGGSTSFPDAPQASAVDAPRRLLLVGTARGGVVAPVVLDHPDGVTLAP